MSVLRYKSLSNPFIKTTTSSNTKLTLMPYFRNLKNPASVKLILFLVCAYSQTHHRLFMTGSKEVHTAKSLSHLHNLQVVLMPCMGLRANFMLTGKLMKLLLTRRTSFNWIAISSSALFVHLRRSSRSLFFALQLKWFFLNSQLPSLILMSRLR